MMTQRNNNERQRSIAEYVGLCRQWGEFLHYTMDEHGVLIVDSDGAHAQALRARLATASEPLSQGGSGQAMPCGRKGNISYLKK